MPVFKLAYEGWPVHPAVIQHKDLSSPCVSSSSNVCVSVCFTVPPADRVFTGAGRCSQETEAGLQLGEGGGLHESGELRTALPRAHWEETPSETEPCLSEDLSPSFFIT